MSHSLLKAVTLLVFVSVLRLTAEGQANDPIVTILEYPANENMYGEIKLLGSINGEVYAHFTKFTSSQRVFSYVACYGDNLAAAESKLVEPVDEGIVKALYIHEDKILSFSINYNESTSKSSVMLQQYDPKSLTTDKSAKEILSGDFVFSGKQTGFNKGKEIYLKSDKSIFIARSPNKEFFAVVAESEQVNGDAKLQLSILNQNLDIVHTRDVPLSDRNILFYLFEVKVDNAGRVYVLAGSFNHSRIADTKIMPKFTYKSYFIEYGRKEVIAHTFSLGEYFINSLSIGFQDDGSYAAAGFYSEDVSRDISGTCFFHFGANGQVVTSSSAFLTRYGILSRQLVGIGSEEWLLIGEQDKVHSNTSHTTNAITGITKSSDSPSYESGDIYIARLSSDGTTKWLNQIPKRQYAGLEALISSSAIVSEGTVYLVFNDHPRNLKPLKYSIEDYSHWRSPIMLVMATVNRSGELSNWPLYEGEKRSVNFAASKAILLEDNTIAVIGISKGKVHLVKARMQ